MRVFSKYYVYLVVVNGIESVMMMFNSKGEHVPMMYLSVEEAETSEIRDLVRGIANKHNMLIELREYVMERCVTQYFPENTLTM